ncbi:DoxX-like family protein [Lysinibacillus piscis]|uniref:Membrane protein n=1 Tax=Lysinibacillus piscis TaxID=2518931 RepID=A0ABQ5NKK6_9BACI|nr:DoxX-like family protein [Lysinibacillus sp. KH24]GLC88888.1 membrane protein [Lysinibacillus sp. KH24]
MQHKPIYVEIEMATTSIEQVWTYTQTPALHEQWDLRFTSITYLPKATAAEPQRFTYTTKIMPGLAVSGWGESKGEHHKEDGTRTSSLHFGTPQKMSPIAEGRGYWQYIPHHKGLTFLTQYDYDVRYGSIGKFFDLFFRPMMGWATALSFDVLRRWLEKGENPASQYRRFFLVQLVSLLFCFVWLYHGLVPKVLIPHADEVKMTAQLLTVSDATVIVYVIGIVESLFALCWLWPSGKRLLFGLQIGLFPLLTVSAILADDQLAIAPFNPITFNSALWVLSIIGLVLSKDMPSAKSCKRKRGASR